MSLQVPYLFIGITLSVCDYIIAQKNVKFNMEYCIKLLIKNVAERRNKKKLDGKN